MCTVSYIATSEGYVLTSNRDEAMGRRTLAPEWWSPKAGSAFRAPRDLEKNGTWIASGKDGRSACLLNGAFEKHHRQLSYAASRGALIPMAFQMQNFPEFVANYDFSGFEPFTLILIDDLLQVVRWDGRRRVVEFLSKSRPYLWSSATLYTESIHREKYKRFEAFLQRNPSPEPQHVLELHGLKTANDFVIKRAEVQTVSITQVVAGTHRAEMQYHQPSYLFDKV